MFKEVSKTFSSATLILFALHNQNFKFSEIFKTSKYWDDNFFTTSKTLFLDVFSLLNS
jgi:hypothetical protein